MRHLNIRVFGQVQGVGFRDTIRQRAEAVDLKGFVRNEPDGSVYIEAEGPEEALEKLVNWCWEGTVVSSVAKVEIEKGDMKNFQDFQTK